MKIASVATKSIPVISRTRYDSIYKRMVDMIDSDSVQVDLDNVTDAIRCYRSIYSYAKRHGWKFDFKIRENVVYVTCIETVLLDE